MYLTQCFSKCGPWTSSINTSWEIIEMQIFEYHSRSIDSETLGVGPSNWILMRPPCDFDYAEIWAPLLIHDIDALGALSFTISRIFLFCLLVWQVPWGPACVTESKETSTPVKHDWITCLLHYLSLSLKCKFQHGRNLSVLFSTLIILLVQCLTQGKHSINVCKANVFTVKIYK